MQAVEFSESIRCQAMLEVAAFKFENVQIAIDTKEYYGELFDVGYVLLSDVDAEDLRAFRNQPGHLHLSDGRILTVSFVDGDIVETLDADPSPSCFFFIVEG